MKMKRIFSILMIAMFALTANAATIRKNHFEGGSNLTEGAKKGTAGTLADLIIAIQNTSTTQSSNITALQAADVVLTNAVATKQTASGLLTIDCNASAGGAATEALTCTGLLLTDTILSVVQKTPGANSLPLLGWSTVIAGGLTGIWSADPGAGAVVMIAVKR